MSPDIKLPAPIPSFCLTILLKNSSDHFLLCALLEQTQYFACAGYCEWGSACTGNSQDLTAGGMAFFCPEKGIRDLGCSCPISGSAPKPHQSGGTVSQNTMWVQPLPSHSQEHPQPTNPFTANSPSLLIYCFSHLKAISLISDWGFFFTHCPAIWG